MIGSDPNDFVVYTTLRSVWLKRIKLALNIGNGSLNGVYTKELHTNFRNSNREVMLVFLYDYKRSWLWIHVRIIYVLHMEVKRSKTKKEGRARPSYDSCPTRRFICIGNYTVREVLMKNRTRVWRNVYNTASA